MENKIFFITILVIIVVGIGGAFVEHSKNQVEIAKINSGRCK
jgi:uncharacterized membrane protein